MSVDKVAEIIGRDFTVPCIRVGTQTTKTITLGEFARIFQMKDKTQIERLNITSLEVTNTILGQSIRSPRVVREIDWIDSIYKKIDHENFPKVQKYCLMSPAHSYTDFHIDFGGT